MNPYKKYLALDYEKLSEPEMMSALDAVLVVADNSGDSQNFYSAMTPIILATLKLKYKTVGDRLRKIYPLSFPEMEKSYPNMPYREVKAYPATQMPTPVYPKTKQEKKALNEINKLVKGFRKNV